MENSRSGRASQLGIKMEEIEMNPIMMQWVSTHFSSVKKIASQYNKQIENEHMQDTSKKQLNDPET